MFIFEYQKFHTSYDKNNNPRWYRKSFSSAAKAVAWFSKNETYISRYYLFEKSEITLDELKNGNGMN